MREHRAPGHNLVEIVPENIDDASDRLAHYGVGLGPHPPFRNFPGLIAFR